MYYALRSGFYYSFESRSLRNEKIDSNFPGVWTKIPARDKQLKKAISSGKVQHFQSVPTLKKIELYLKNVSDSDTDLSPITTPSQVVQYLGDMRHMAYETLRLVVLDTSHRPICIQDVSRGGTRQTVFFVADIVRSVLVAGGVSFILAHNHPSGCLAASTSDINTTRRLLEVCSVVGLRLQDHLIVSKRGWISIRNEKLLDFSIKGQEESFLHIEP